MGCSPSFSHVLSTQFNLIKKNQRQIKQLQKHIYLHRQSLCASSGLYTLFNIEVITEFFRIAYVNSCDYTQFTILSLASVGLGAATSVFFLVTVREKKIVEGKGFGLISLRIVSHRVSCNKKRV
jgi:hypothetical protein